MRNGIARLPLSELNRTEQNTAKPPSWKSPRDSEYTRAEANLMIETDDRIETKFLPFY